MRITSYKRHPQKVVQVVHLYARAWLHCEPPNVRLIGSDEHRTWSVELSPDEIRQALALLPRQRQQDQHQAQRDQPGDQHDTGHQAPVSQHVGCIEQP